MWWREGDTHTHTHREQTVSVEAEQGWATTWEGKRCKKESVEDRANHKLVEAQRSDVQHMDGGWMAANTCAKSHAGRARCLVYCRVGTSPDALGYT